MRVIEVWRYPVKSMGGERLAETTVGPAGIEGDRAFGVVDGTTGKVLSAKTVPLLLQATATWLQDGAVRVTSDAGGLDVTTGEDGGDERLSSWLGRPVRLERPVPGQRASFDMELDPDDPTETRELHTPPGSFFDSRSTLHVLTTASLGEHDVRRFRPNLLVDADGDHPEDAWVGGRLRIGEALVASVRKATARCVLVTKPQPGLAQDSSIFRDLVRRRQGNLGVYADPTNEGTVGAGACVAVEP